ncbi:hypothetical protein RhiXN_09327 [Rhizoctonia solani]|uniref:Uncharacterized protein n=1 Tax=Rhizoctonia solani TaxID=456999 RepID=A0A8H8SXA7_9AGAM|nr:uncharacterized protein RhiXN_09327 [Rhizoctonia solani]QRW20352.1 hypothetical protein RhiXN_09327 [Rhizoctonia solani]
MLVAAASFIASSGFFWSFRSRLKLTFQAHTNSAMFSSAHLAFFAAAAAALVAASPVTELEGQTLAKRETSYGNPDLVTDQGNRFKLNFGSTDGHPNACPGHYICYISKNGAQHGDVSLGNPDDFVDEGNRWASTFQWLCVSPPMDTRTPALDTTCEQRSEEFCYPATGC